MGVYIGLDIGGTKFMAAAANAEGRILRRVRELNAGTLESDLALLNDMIRRVTGGEAVLGMGAAIGGQLDWERGIVSPLHQPTWRQVPLKAIMEKTWGCPFFVDVDTNIAALGEYAYGEVKANRLLYLTLSTGMGGGFLVDGRLYRGTGGAHPEVAHQSITYRCAHPERIRCECGAPDCLEALVSGNGIRRIYGVPAEELNREQWSEVAYNLGQGLRNMAALLAPEVICIGGGVAVGGGQAFIAEAGETMHAGLRLVPAPALKLSELVYDTALLGAVYVAIHGMSA